MTLGGPVANIFVLCPVSILRDRPKLLGLHTGIGIKNDVIILSYSFSTDANLLTSRFT